MMLGCREWIVALACLAVIFSVSSAKLVKLDWTVAYKFISPDCVEKLAPVVNGQYPGPTLDVDEGDDVEVYVKNELPTEAILIHWHGIDQRGTPYADGSPETQCHILPASSYVYSFKADRAGTFWWHAHSGLHKGSLYGAIIVRAKKPEPFKYDGEHVLLLNDWWHTSQIEQMAGLDERLPLPFRWVNNPDSLLINGVGLFNGGNCTGVTGCNTTKPECGYKVFEVEHGKTYRIRAIGAGSLVLLNLLIQSHSLQVVETDGDYTRRANFGTMEVNNGESFSFLVKADQPIGNYWIRTAIRQRTNVGTTGLAILRYKGAPNELPTAKVGPGRDNLDRIIARAERVVSQNSRVVPDYDREFIFVGTQNRAKDYLKWSVNNISQEHDGSPAILVNSYGSLKKDRVPVSQPVPAMTYDYNKTLVENGLSIEAKLASHIISLKKGEVIQIVLQNTRALNGVAEYHPWHLHGHNFWVLAYGTGTYDRSKPPKLNVKNPPYKNTVSLWPQGYTIIRFVADNPGVWLFHCHILPHLYMGMGLAFLEAADEIPPPPRGTPVCGKVTPRDTCKA